MYFSDYVKLHAPTDVTTAYIGNTDVFLFWYAPPNYEVYCAQDLNRSEIDRIRYELNGSFPDDGRYVNRTLFNVSEIDYSRVDGADSASDSQGKKSDISSNNTKPANTSATDTMAELSHSLSIDNVTENRSTADSSRHSNMAPKNCVTKHSIGHSILNLNDSHVVLKSQAKILHYNVTYAELEGG